MAHEQVGIGWGLMGAHGRTFDLEVMTGVEVLSLPPQCMTQILLQE